MVNLLIVDDEYFVRVGISSAFDWEKYDITIVGEAANGQEALDIIHQKPVDVVLLDIVMPVMDGVEFLKIIRKEERDIAVIVLSANNDFEHVREAMRLGAVDYLLKLSIDTQNLLDLILNHGRKYIQAQQGKNGETTSEIWAKLLLDNNCEELSALQHTLMLKPIDQLHVFVLGIDNYAIENAPEKYGVNDHFLRTVRQIIMEEMRNYGPSTCFHIQQGQFVALLKQGEYTASPNQLRMLLKKINAPLRVYKSISVSMGASIISGSLEGAHTAYEKALNAYQQKFYLQPGSLILDTDAGSETDKRTILETGDESKLRHNIVETRNLDYAMQYIRDIVDDMEKNNRNNDGTQVRYVLNEVLFVLCSCMKIYNLCEQNVDAFGEGSVFEQLRRFEFFSDLKTWFLELCEEYFFRLRHIVTPIENREIQKMLEFIQANYNKKIDLNTISAHVSISSAYASHIFKKEVGRGVVEYLSFLRIEKAKELLCTTDMNLADIAAMVGFDNMYYFSNVFKRLVRLSPGRYREQARKNDVHEPLGKECDPHED